MKSQQPSKETVEYARLLKRRLQNAVRQEELGPIRLGDDLIIATRVETNGLVTTKLTDRTRSILADAKMLPWNSWITG